MLRNKVALPALAKPFEQIWCIATRRPPEEWPKKFGGDGDFLNQSIDFLSTKPTTMTLVYYEDSKAVLPSVNDFQAIVFSSKFKKRFPRNLSVETCFNDTNSAQDLADTPLYFVCAHGNRDKRCGEKGMPIVQALRKQGKLAFGCSHIGGHQFAGNVISLPTAAWFSNIDKDNAVDMLSITPSAHTCLVANKPFCRGCSW